MAADARLDEGAEAEPLTLPTALPGLELRALTAADARAYAERVAHNRAHLTQCGDYAELAAASSGEIAAELAAASEGSLRMGVWRGEALLGRADLNPVAPGVYVLGYWLGVAHSRHGTMTAACRALLAHARQALGAVEFWAGVKPANRKSVALLE
ncbi:MAG: GNAT family protein, partial [Chloroflexota bacterium]